MTKESYIHLYTGNGKGKTTAAFGVAVRAICAGKNVYIGQFVKGMKYSETKLEEYFDNIKIEQFGQDCFIDSEPKKEDYERARKGLNKIEQILKSSSYDLVILDELTIAIYYGLVDLDELINILINRNSHIEVVITGRYAPAELIELADLVTEMKEIKHYYQLGQESRPGIDC